MTQGKNKEFIIMSENYEEVQGIALPVTNLAPKLWKEEWDHFVFEDGDVLILTYPKSGTSWCIEILSLIYTKGDPKWIRSVPIWDRSPWLETIEGYELLKAKEGPRLISSHLPIQLFPKSFFNSKAKVIYVIRNPRDILVSGYFFWNSTSFAKKAESLEQYLEWFIQGNAPTKIMDTELIIEDHRWIPIFPVGNLPTLGLLYCVVLYGSWFDHIHGWMVMKENPNFLLLSYEELKWDIKGSVKKICQFWGKKLEPEELNSLIENSSFNIMKDNKMSNFSLIDSSIINLKYTPFLRKGITGDWKNYFTVAQAEIFNKIFKEKMADLPQELFPWE